MLSFLILFKINVNISLMRGERVNKINWISLICCSQPESTVEFLCRPVRLSCGQQHTAVVSSSGDVYTWGRSQKGRYIIVSIFMNIATIKLESHNYINNYCSFYLIRFFPYLRLGAVLMMIRCYYGTHFLNFYAMHCILFCSFFLCWW